MFSFCPHCGETLGQEQAAGQTVICRHCGKTIGTIPTAAKAKVVDQTEEWIRQGKAVRCSVCGQAVEVKVRDSVRSIVPHAAPPSAAPAVGLAPKIKMCPGGGKLIVQPKVVDRLRSAMTKDVIQVILCPKNAEPTIEELTLEYLDKADRVRLQIDALRELLGRSFQMHDYPESLGKPLLAYWRSAEACVIAKKNPNGGYQAMTADEITRVLADLRQARGRFFA